MMNRYAFALLLALSLLAENPANAANYRLAAGDVVAVIVHGIIGEHGKSPVHFPKDDQEFLPAMGHPCLVLKDGKLHLPLVEPVNVNNMTVAEAQRQIEQAYLTSDVIKQRGSVMVTLMRKRTVDVLVVHETVGATRSSSASVQIPADQSSPLAAIVESGNFDPNSIVRVYKPAFKTTGRSLPSGSMVVVQSPAAGRYYTGGRLQSGEHSLPIDRNLNLLQAISAAGGMNHRGLLEPHRVLIVRPHQATINVPWSQLLANPSVIVQSGDTLIVE